VRHEQCSDAATALEDASDDPGQALLWMTANRRQSTVALVRSIRDLILNYSSSSFADSSSNQWIENTASMRDCLVIITEPQRKPTKSVHLLKQQGEIKEVIKSNLAIQSIIIAILV
jgi:hypothetical protein